MELGTWVDHAESQVVQTSWAALALMSARYPCSEPIQKAVGFVMSKQASVRMPHIEVNCGLSTKMKPF
jgi:squalene cyclase